MKKLCFMLALLLLLGGCGTEKAQKPPAAAGHADQNNDGLCDDCKAGLLVRIEILAVNDLHGRLMDTAYQGGVDELSTYLRQHTENRVLLATGDMWQGTSESNLTQGRIITEWMNQMGFAAMTVGGHEFDWGQETVAQNKDLAQFPFLGINVYSRNTNQRVEYCDASTVVEYDGVQVGIIGAIGDCTNSVSPENTRDIYFKVGSELTALVKAEADRLRAEGVDFIIYAIHDGSALTTTGDQTLSVSAGDLRDYYDTTLSEGFVDLVFEADTHYWYKLTDQHGIYHLQAGANNQGISQASLLINKANGHAELVSAELIPASRYQNLTPDPVVAELLEKYAPQIQPATRPLGINGQYMGNFALCQLVADLYCRKGVEKWGADYDIVLGGGYISCRSPGYMDAGEVTYSQLQSLFPFDNRIVLGAIKGSNLVSKFLETEHRSYYIKTTAYGESIRSAIDPEATYYVITDSYSANYAPNGITVIDTYAAGVYARDLLAAYIQDGNLE